ncbi:hypothetical protein [Larkinella sp. C7]|jgi:hypothetical protein|uniref:hypothetical protein n=1 Tax=Larkinella sp. C7 TaxID=2576607 RepID=UPI001486C804|nr:hypothetical protein [Larkinella sp. C7]
MKKLFWGGLYLVMMTPVYAQHIEQIRAFASGDTILISYDLVGGSPSQSYKIRASCWDGIGKTELKSIQGLTVVKPGRNHQLKWRVLNDMEIGLVGDSITFTLAASEYNPPIGGWNDKSLTIEDRKAILIMDLTSQIDAYLNEVYNTAKLFRGYSDGAVTGQSALRNLDEQRKLLNAAYNTLLKNRRTFELTVQQLWKDETKTAIAETFFTTILDRMHREHILPLNDDVLPKMYDYNTFGNKAYRNKQLLKNIQTRAQVLTDPLLTHKIETARNDARNLYSVSLKQ